jgi:hypothetical protein
MWGFGGSMTLKEREKLSKRLADVVPTHEIQLTTYASSSRRQRWSTIHYD